MAGLSGGFLAGDDLDVTLDESSIRRRGSFLGAGGIMVFWNALNSAAPSRVPPPAPITIAPITKTTKAVINIAAI